MQQEGITCLHRRGEEETPRLEIDPVPSLSPVTTSGVLGTLRDQSLPLPFLQSRDLPEVRAGPQIQALVIGALTTILTFYCFSENLYTREQCLSNLAMNVSYLGIVLKCRF